MIDWTDRRPIATMTFGAEAPEAERAGVVERVREMLYACGCTVADDIAKLGCTGVAAHAIALGCGGSVAYAGRFLRLGLAGGGVGLPCFVPPTRYCLIHDTTGGLQDGQQQHHAEFVAAVSRELSHAERSQTAMVEAARRVKGAEAASELLTGYKRGEAVKAVKERLEDDGVGELPVSEAATAAPMPMSLSFSRSPEDLRPWKCHEHDKVNWNCRYCVAQAIVEGPLEPVFGFTDRAGFARVGDSVRYHGIEPTVAATLAALTAQGEQAVQLYVRIATFSTKLSQD